MAHNNLNVLVSAGFDAEAAVRRSVVRRGGHGAPAQLPAHAAAGQP